MIGKTISHYKILEKLGEGGMGIVYKAQDLKLDRFVALKFLPPHLTTSDEEKRRFIHEAKAASALQHNNICAIHEIDETEAGQIFICMDYYEGETLNKKIKEKPLPLKEAIKIAIQIAQGLKKAHSKNIVHRDIKPANILITEEGWVKIIDFGLAKLKGQTMLTKAGTTMGTVAYMSPEQTRGGMVDHRTDIWSLGVLLYEIIAGEQPFKGDYEQAVIYSILNEEPEFITKIRGEVPEQIEQILDKALTKSPEKRFQTMEEMLEQLNNAGEDLSEGLSKKSPLFRLGRKQRRIALLPLKSITQDAEQEWFTDGMTDALITDLAKIGGIRVISRSSAMKYKSTDKTPPEIAAELGVQYVIEGSIVKMRDQVKVSARLINAPDDEYLWADDYERAFSNILALQSEIAQTIAHKIQVQLTPEEQKRLNSVSPVNPEAHEAYLKGMFHWYKLSPQDLEIALHYFELALEKDPNYALAHAGIALVWGGQMQMGLIPHREAGPRVKAAAARALELDSTLVEVHHTLALSRAWWEWDWEGAETAFRQAIALNPNYPDTRAYYSHFLNIIGRPEEAIVQIECALELDPLNSLFQALYCMDLLYMHRYDDATTQLRNTLKFAPNEPVVRSTMRTAFHMKGMYKEALEEWKAFYIARGDREAEEALARGYLEDGYPGAMLFVAETMEKRSQTTYVTPWQIGTLYTRAGKKDKALDWLEKAFEARDVNVPYLSVDPLFDDLRSDPRFQNLLRRLNLPENKNFN